jgi:hypothetical protein
MQITKYYTPPPWVVCLLRRCSAARLSDVLDGERGAEVLEFRSSAGWNVLHMACGQRRDLALLLLERCPHLLYEGDLHHELPVHVAARCGQIEILEAMVALDPSVLLCRKENRRVTVLSEALFSPPRHDGRYSPLMDRRTPGPFVKDCDVVVRWVTDRVPEEVIVPNHKGDLARVAAAKAQKCMWRLLGSLSHSKDSVWTREHWWPMCEARLLRVEASLVYPWWPDDLHSLFSDHLKKTIATFRVGTWYLAHMTEYVDPLHAERSLPWLVVSYAMPHIGLGWMAPGWLPPSETLKPPVNVFAAVKEGGTASADDSSDVLMKSTPECAKIEEEGSATVCR